ncbi:DRAP deaminase [Coemansia guatemalensis]|uniref:Pseudouridine synthase n=1 Tax=Coemansia guatemalensis TaxID=2761395 RepID=A0A9W8LR29_9FUNG|nr:DRAP deaminase [Coemansia guatemalensis]
MAPDRKHKLQDNHADKTLESNHRAKNAKIQDNSTLKNSEVYYTDGGLQRIRPYYHQFATYAKGRWVGRTIFDVFTKEFRDRNAEYYERAIEAGLIELNGKSVDKDTVVRNGDLVTHYIHRHEPPVTTQSLGIVRETEDGLLVIDKPGSIPVHPSGRYSYNTVLRILEIKHGYKSLFPVNRLDRLTSGLMLIGLNADVARQLKTNMVEHTIQKEYVCKVVGKFPEGKIICDQPIRVVAHKLALNCVDTEQGKPSLTEFERLRVDGDYSIVYCRPKTGRTHQIRVHLQFLGFPIANDPLYNNTEVWGDNLGKDGMPPTISEQSNDGNLEISRALEKPVFDPALRPTKMAGKCDEEGNNGAWSGVIRRMEDWQAKQDAVRQVNSNSDGPRMCEVCENPNMPDPTPEQLCIWLHALRYSGPGWSFKTTLPDWAKDVAVEIEQVMYRPEMQKDN